VARLYAHRGAAAEEPENTVASFRRALEHGADALEMDVHMTCDGHVVVSHDPDGARMAGVAVDICCAPLREVRSWDAGWGVLRGRERPFAGRGYRIPTLEEVIVEFPGVPLNIDVKQRRPDMVPSIVALLRRLRAEDRVLLASFSSWTLRRLRLAGWHGSTALGRADVLALLVVPAIAVRAVRRLPLVRPGDAAQVPVRAAGITLGTRRFIDKCHAVGMRVDYWTVNDPEEARRLLALGADGIMTDDPARIAPVMG
jgi:glycerophosphoryl diester phosphodiesterase